MDSLSCKGLNPNQIIVTSVLRTADDVKRLRRRNGNASAIQLMLLGQLSMSMSVGFVKWKTRMDVLCRMLVRIR